MAGPQFIPYSLTHADPGASKEPICGLRIGNAWLGIIATVSSKITMLFVSMAYAFHPNYGQFRFHRLSSGPMPFRFHSWALSPAEGIMPTYRAYLIDQDDRVKSFSPVEADSDEDALVAATRFVDGHDVEVWLLDRMVGRLTKQV